MSALFSADVVNFNPFAALKSFINLFLLSLKDFNAACL
jgi:hypothetical protein